VDSRINTLAQRGGDFAALFYTWAIPHADDDAILRGNEEEIMAKVIPLRRDKTPQDVAAVLTLIHELKMIVWDKANEAVYFPPEAFYKYQAYISSEKRRKSQPQWVSLISANSRQSPPLLAENSASPSPSPSPSVKEESQELTEIDLEANPPDSALPEDTAILCFANKSIWRQHKQKVAAWKGLCEHGLTFNDLEQTALNKAKEAFCLGVRSRDRDWCKPLAAYCPDCVQAKFAECIAKAGKPRDPVAYWCAVLARLPTEDFAREHIGEKAKGRLFS